MSVWDEYEHRRIGIGKSKHDMLVYDTRLLMKRRMFDSPSCRRVKINGSDQVVCVAHTSDLNVKKIAALPGETLKHGGIVDFARNKWLITEVDADNLIYEKGLMQQCNHMLRWIDKNGKLIEKWCIVVDGTKYLIGEKTHEVLTVGDARIAVTVGKDEDTVGLMRGLRFLIDDTDSDDILAYQITKPNKLFNIFEGEGCFRFILNEVQLTDDDNKTLRVADYSNWKPSIELDSEHADSEYTVAEIVTSAIEESNEPLDDDKDVWL